MKDNGVNGLVQTVDFCIVYGCLCDVRDKQRNLSTSNLVQPLVQSSLNYCNFVYQSPCIVLCTVLLATANGGAANGAATHHLMLDCLVVSSPLDKLSPADIKSMGLQCIDPVY